MVFFQNKTSWRVSRSKFILARHHDAKSNIQSCSSIYITCSTLNPNLLSTSFAIYSSVIVFISKLALCSNSHRRLILGQLIANFFIFAKITSNRCVPPSRRLISTSASSGWKPTLRMKIDLTLKHD
jgi:hypothetical protein